MTKSEKVKAYLNQIKYVDEQIDSRQRELTDIKEKGFLKATAIKGINVKESHMESYDEKYLKIWSLPVEINQEIDRYIELKAKIRQQINSLEDQLEALVLRERYLNNKKWIQIAVSINQSERHIQRVHGQALISFYDQFESEIENHNS